MNLGGWIFMLASLSFVIGLLTWCLWHVLANHGPADDCD